MSKLNSCLRSGHVSFGDDLNTVAEVTHLFGLMAMKLPYHSWFNVPGKQNVIGWLPSEEGGKGWHNVPEFGPDTDSRGWCEILTISEYNDDAETTAKRVQEELAATKTRCVFWRRIARRHLQGTRMRRKWHMIVWNPVDSFVSKLASSRQRYRCRVDGQDEYRGESLPTGTQAEVLAWIEARYKLLGELYVFSHDRFISPFIMLLISPEMWEIVPTTKRYLVEVEGVEKVFVLEPIHEDLLGWHPERALAWNGEC